MFYTNWCGLCKKVQPIVEELAVKLAAMDDVVIARYDATENEHPGVDVRNYPSFELYGRD